MKWVKAKTEPDVVFTQLDNDDGVLLHFGTQAYYTLNPTGSFIWQLIDKGLDFAQIGVELESRYDISAEDARQNVADLAADLADQKLITLYSD